MNKTLDKLFDELWPICRSVAGPGFDKSLNILSNNEFDYKTKLEDEKKCLRHIL